MDRKVEELNNGIREQGSDCFTFSELNWNWVANGEWGARHWGLSHGPFPSLLLFY